jgi:L-threonylcarbamoyladenylate synthase
MAEVVDVTGEGREEAVARAVALLRDGALVVLPTDTGYGVAADAFDRDGTARVFAARGQSEAHPLPVFVRSPKQVIGLTPAVPAAAEALMAAYWPGPLTLVVPAEPSLRWELGHDGGAVAVRMPLDDVALAVVRAVGPLAVTAAARVGHPLPVEIADAVSELGDAVALYLDDGPRGTVGRSTIVDLTGAAPRVLRSGALDDARVLAVARGELDPFEATSLDPPTGDGTDGEG